MGWSEDPVTAVVYRGSYKYMMDVSHRSLISGHNRRQDVIRCHGERLHGKLFFGKGRWTWGWL